MLLSTIRRLNHKIPSFVQMKEKLQECLQQAGMWSCVFLECSCALGVKKPLSRESRETGNRRNKPAVIDAVRARRLRRKLRYSTVFPQPATLGFRNFSQLKAMDSIEFDGDLAQAAVKIQASFRGHMARKQAEKTRQEMENIKEADKQPKEDPDPLLDVDLKDPALENAAVKIQASFRGHMTRKTLKDGE